MERVALQGPLSQQGWLSRPATALLAFALLLLAKTAGAAQGVNLIVNGNAETGTGGDGFNGGTPIPSWTIVEGDPRIVLYTAGGGFPDAGSPGPVNRGSDFFAGGPNFATSRLRQTIDVSAEAQPIDLGIVEFLLTGWLGGFLTETDNARVTITFLNASSSPIGTSTTIGPVTATDRGNATALLLRTARGTVPSGARSIRVDLIATNGGSGYNDGYADNLSLVLQSPDRRGGEFPVNTYTTGDQVSSSVAMDSAGRFVVTWHSVGQDGSEEGVFAQRFDQNGLKQGAELQVNSYTTDWQWFPSVATDAPGNFVIAWQNTGNLASGAEITGQRFNAAGVKQGVPDFSIDSDSPLTSQSNASVAVDPDGDFVVVWHSGYDVQGDFDIHGQRFNAVGTKQGGEFTINTYLTALQTAPDVAIDGAGNFTVVWNGSGEGDSQGVFGRRFDNAGSPLEPEFRISSAVNPSQSYPSIAMSDEGDFVVVWNSYFQDGSGAGVFGQRYDALGAKQGPEFRANARTAGVQSASAVAMDGSGNFVVVWHDEFGDEDVFGITGRQFDRDGCPLGPEFQVNTYATGTQSYPSVAISPSGNGNFVVVWESRFQDGSLKGVFGQRFKLRLPTVAISAGAGTSVCRTGTGTTVTARDAYPPVSYQWGRRSVSGGTITPISGETGDTYVLSGADFPASGSYFLVCTTFPVCGADRTSNEIAVTVTAGPTTAAAGPDQTICSGSTTAPLGGNTPVVGTGTWSVVGGGTGTFSPNASTPNATFHHTGGAGPVTLRWTISSASCPSSQDNVSVSIVSCELEPASLAVDAAANGALSNGDGVLSPGERVRLQPAWHNLTGSPISATGAASDFSGPAGGSYTLNDGAASYGSVGGGATNSCVATGNCYEATVSAATRPAPHWDADFDETLSTGDPVKNWTLHVGDSFADVPRNYLFYRRVETVLHHGITAGCSPTQYCPNDKVKRDQMALFLGRAIAEGGSNIPVNGTVGANPYNCVAGGVSLFTDVAPADSTCRAIHYIASQNVTGGCGGTLYCPAQNVNRAEMGIFVARGIEAPGGGAAVPLTYGPDPVTTRSYSCDPASPNVFFTDITTGDSFCKHVHYLWAKGIVSGCSTTEYCPAGEVTRGEMARFLSTAFEPNLYAP